MSSNNELPAEQQALIHRYLRGQMPDEEVEAFEISLMDNPDMVEHLELEEVFTACLPDAERKLKKRFSLWKWFTSTPMGASIGTCAMTALLTTSVMLNLFEPDGEPHGIATGNVLFLETLRSSNANLPTLYLDASDTNAVLYLQTELLNKQAVNVQVVTQSSGKTVVNTDGQLQNGELLLAIPRNRLQAGIYQLNVTKKDGKEVASHKFKVNLEEPNHGVQSRE